MADAGVGRAGQRVLDAVRAAGEPVGVRDLAAELDVHLNTVRLQLANLVALGLVVREREAAPHRGRPGYRYRAVPDKGRSAVREVGRAIGRVDGRSLDEWFDDLGFRPRRADGDLVLDACPFVAPGDDGATVCALHLGLAEGVAERSGATVLGLDRGPDGCRLRLA